MENCHFHIHKYRINIAVHVVQHNKIQAELSDVFHTRFTEMPLSIAAYLCLANFVLSFNVDNFI